MSNFSSDISNLMLHLSECRICKPHTVENNKFNSLTNVALPLFFYKIISTFLFPKVTQQTEINAFFRLLKKM